MQSAEQPTGNDLILALKEAGSPSDALHLARFFKTGEGEYGEGDQFLGVRVPVQRSIARRFSKLSLEEIDALLRNPFHEVRLTALFVLVGQFKQGDEPTRERLYNFYMGRLDRLNNWDLVDSTAKYIAGDYLYKRDRGVLYELATSPDLWTRRVGIVATHYFIDRGDLTDAFGISELLLDDSHDLIHKAVGWMLREAGKKNAGELRSFLRMYYDRIQRTTLRYAIEKFDAEERKAWLRGPHSI